ncbi:ComF family protein [Octadecabacter sp.]|nr:ComF family protein [Octadecabacter sp.]
MLQSMIRSIYPPQCVLCDARTMDDFALCGPCWAETPFIDGGCCNRCGAPLAGTGPDEADVLCDDCIAIARPWTKGRATFVYSGKARRFVLSLKHGDRTDLARAAGPWMARAGKDILKPTSLLVPIPLHRFRLLRRKYNQAAVLAEWVSKAAQVDVLADGLIRPTRTAPLEKYTRDERFETMQGAIIANPNRVGMLKARQVVLVDDVMTSGATFSAATEACYAAGADDVCVLALARVVKDA